MTSLFIAILLGGLVAFFLSAFLLRRFARTSHRCIHCGYDLSATSPSLPCPECGNPHAQERAQYRRVSLRSFLWTALSSWPFALAPVFVLALNLGHDASDDILFLCALIALICLPYLIIQLGCLAIGRFNSLPDTCGLALGSSAIGAVLHTLIAIDIFVWHPDPLGVLALFGSIAFVCPVSGYGTLLATAVLRMQPRSAA